MKVNILAFGIAKDILGHQFLEMEIEEGNSLQELKNLLLDLYPEFSRLYSLRLAVNESYASENQILLEGDEIAIIPPVSGG